MQRKFSLPAILRFIRRPAFALCAVWCAGLILGTIFAASPDTSFSSLMRPSYFDGLSIVRQLAAVFLPFLFAAYAVSIDKPKLLLVLCFIKTFMFSFCGHLICRTYGSAGWLMRFLLQFSDILTVPVLCWFCLRHIGKHSLSSRRDFTICGLLVTVVACIDIFAVSPILAELIDYSMGRYAYSCWI